MSLIRFHVLDPESVRVRNLSRKTVRLDSRDIHRHTARQSKRILRSHVIRQEVKVIVGILCAESWLCVAMLFHLPRPTCT